MADEEMKAAAEQVLRDGGCEAVRVEGAGEEWFVSCGFEPGQFFVTAFSKRNPFTPNDPVYLAKQALATLIRNERPAAKTEEPVSLGSDILAAEEEMQQNPGRTLTDWESRQLERDFDPNDPTEGMGDDDGGDDDPIDADYFEPEPALEGEDLNLTPALPDDYRVEEGQGEGEGSDGPIAYAASDFDGLIREKLGRVGQIARALKAELQEGWSIAEFRSLQNHIQRIERGEAPDDHDARERFFAISERSQAMSRVETARDAHEAALDAIGQARDYAAAQAYDPEQGWE